MATPLEKYIVLVYSHGSELVNVDPWKSDTELRKQEAAKRAGLKDLENISNLKDETAYSLCIEHLKSQNSMLWSMKIDLEHTFWNNSEEIKKTVTETDDNKSITAHEKKVALLKHNKELRAMLKETDLEFFGVHVDAKEAYYRPRPTPEWAANLVNRSF